MKTPVKLLCAIILFCCMSCEKFWNHCIEGNGNRITETRDLSQFSLIQVNGDFEVQVDTGSSSMAIVEADENLMDLIVTRVTGDRLIIESRNGDCLRPSHPIEITITTPLISGLDLNGSGYIYSNGFTAGEVEMKLSGSGQIECNDMDCSTLTCEIEGSGYIRAGITSENLAAKIEGSGEIRLSGEAVNSDISIIGSGNINSGNLITDVCEAYISGSGTIDIFVNDALDATINGSGIIYYGGDPTITSHISGSGKIVHSK